LEAWYSDRYKAKGDRGIKRMGGGKLIEPKYTEGVSSTQLINDLKNQGVTPQTRIKQLRRLLAVKPITRILEVHNGLTGLIAEKTRIQVGREIKEFDGMWLSSLTDSISKGKPDTGSVDFSSRLNTINQVFEVTTKPMVVDGDSGGLIEHFVPTVKTLERLGVSAVIIEDKIGAKRNSLFGADVAQSQDSPKNFARKILAGKQAQVTDDFMIIARIESLILGKGVKDALLRARTYIKGGADAIMIHSKEKKPKEILDFCREYAKFENKAPIVVVPTTYSSVTERRLERAGVQLVIYANHLLRSAYPAMTKTAEAILLNSRAKECEGGCMPISEILDLIPGSK